MVPLFGVALRMASRRSFLPLTEAEKMLLGFAGQLQSSLNGGSLPHGGMDELMPPAPPLDADTPLDAALLLDVDTPRDP